MLCFFLLAFYYCFHLLFPEGLTVVRKYTISICSETQIMTFILFVDFLIFLWLGSFLCCSFFLNFLINFLVLVLAVVFLIVTSSMVYCLEFVPFSVSWLLDSILCAFSELF